MKHLFTLLMLVITAIALGQKKSQKAAVFKVRSPAAVCSIFIEDSCLWLEKDNRIKVKVRSKCKKIKVVFSSGKVVTQDEDTYTVNFDLPGKLVISVYEMDKKAKLIYTESLKVKEPDLYFCGAKVGSISHGLYMKAEHFKAYSLPFDTALSVLGYDMNYNDGVSTTVYHADDNMLSQEMRDIMFEDSRSTAQKRKSKIVYFSNILTSMPDGSKKMLSPFAVSVIRDSTKKDNIVFNFAVLKMTLKK
jgi:hypothetical protein